jgi:hypothetical protein
MMLSSIDALGYAASGLTLATFAQRTMLPMRMLAIAANLCFIGYGAMGMYMPVLVLHLVLLPINLIRLRALVNQLSTNVDRPREGFISNSSLPGTSSGLL